MAGAGFYRAAMTLHAILFATALAVPSAAAALSCIVPNMGRDFNQLADAPETYVVARGRLVPAGPVPEVSPDRAQSNKVFQALYRFEGQHLGTVPRSDRALSVPVEVTVRCLGPWCAGFPAATDQAMFLERTNGTYRVEIGPCPFGALAAPKPDQMAALRACLSAGRCGEAEIARLGPVFD